MRLKTNFDSLKVPVPSIYLYALTAMLFWGMSFVWTSILLKYYQPVSIIFFRLILSTLFLYAILFFYRNRERMLRRDIKWFFLSALFNPFLYFLGENWGLKYSTSTITSVIIATIPVFSPVAGYLAFRERLRWFNFAGIGVSFLGILVMLATDGFRPAIPAKGILFLGGAVVSSLIYSVLLKRLAESYSPLYIISVQNLTGIFLFLPVFLLFEAHQAIAITPNTEIITSFIFLAVLASSVSFVFFARTVKVLGISKANIFSNLIPVFTAVFSFIILDERFTLQKIIGITIVIGGVYFSELNRVRLRRE